jgi:hypothetical protein
MPWISLPLFALFAVSAVLSPGCATLGGGPSQGISAASEGPAVISARTEPSTIELNRDHQPLRPSVVRADVKDFTAPIQEVVLRFEGVPLEIPMENVGGTIWRAELTQRQLEMLAVTGQTIRYQAHVIARNSQGKLGRTPVPVDVAIKSPGPIVGGVGSG